MTSSFSYSTSKPFFKNSLTDGLPLGFAMGMAMNQQALDHYGKLTEYEKERLIAESRGVKSKEEMDRLVERLGDGFY